MSKGTILYIGGFEFPNKNAASLRALGTAKLLRRIDYNVVLLGIDNSIKWGEGVHNTMLDGFDVWSEPYPQNISELIKFTASISHFKKIIVKYSDVKMVICYDYQALAFARIARYCRNNNLKIVADSTEWYSSKGMGFITGLGKKVDVFYRMKVLQKKLDGLITVSKFLYNYYSNFLDCVIIPPLVDLSEKKWKSMINVANDESIHMIYAGNPGLIKDQLNGIIKIIVSLPISKLVHIDIIGVQLDEYLSFHTEDRDLLEKNLDRITFRGRLSHEECIQKIIQADYFIFWRDDNIVTKAGFPSKLVESLSCGTPVITTKTSNIEDYLKDGENGFLLDFDETKASEKLYEIIAMGKDKANSMKDYCKDYQIFIYENYTEKMKEFINNVL